MPENLRRCSCDVLQLHPCETDLHIPYSCGKDTDEGRYFSPVFRILVEMGPDHHRLTVLFHLHT